MGNVRCRICNHTGTNGILINFKLLEKNYPAVTDEKLDLKRIKIAHRDKLHSGQLSMGGKVTLALEW
jgi:hypothetical protein